MVKRWWMLRWYATRVLREPEALGGPHRVEKAFYQSQHSTGGAVASGRWRNAGAADHRLKRSSHPELEQRREAEQRCAADQLDGVGPGLIDHPPERTVRIDVMGRCPSHNVRSLAWKVSTKPLAVAI